MGTTYATAPEVLRGAGCSVAADWWSFGILVFEMLAGRVPFPLELSQIHAQALLVLEICSGERAPLPEGASADVGALIDGLLVRDEAERLTSPARLRAHPFYSGVRWGLLLAKQVESPLLAIAPPLRASFNSVADGARRPSSILGLHAGLQGDDPREMLEGGVAGWDYDGATGGSRGARLWSRIRCRLDQLARLQGLSRLEFLIFVLLTLAANRATGDTMGQIDTMDGTRSILASLDPPREVEVE